RPPLSTQRMYTSEVLWQRRIRRMDRQGRRARAGVDTHVDRGVVIPRFVDPAIQGRQCDSGRLSGSITRGSQLERSLMDRRRELLWFGVAVNETPVFRTWCPDPFGDCAKQVGVVTADLSFVRQASQAACTRQD